MSLPAKVPGHRVRIYGFAGTVALVAMSLLGTSPRAEAISALDRLKTEWANVNDYSVAIEAHEVSGGRTENHELHYAFRKPGQARLDLMSKNKTVAAILWRGGDTVVAYRPGLSFLKLRGNVHDRRFTSLRGNGVLTPNLGDILACFEQNKSAVRERPGPIVNGEATAEIALLRNGVTCQDDSPADRNITLDLLDVSGSGLVVMRKRYEGDDIVETWTLKNYLINSGLSDSSFE